MDRQTETVEEPKENVFDERGLTVGDEAPAETVEAAPEEVAAPASFKIGDKEFATQDEALTWAQSQVPHLEQEQLLADAYRQGIRDAATPTTPPAQNVTPTVPADDFDETEYYANPKAFLNKFATKIKTETQAALSQQTAIHTESEKIWREFTDRHPELADFREDIEDFVAKNQPQVVAVIGTKGRPAGLDFVATKVKAEFSRKAEALKQKRALPNGTTPAAPNSKSTNVTPNAPQKKASTFYEELRSIRKRR